MNALLIEEHPLIRLGLFQMLENTHGAGNVTTLGRADIPLASGRHRHAALLVFGMAAHWLLPTRCSRSSSLCSKGRYRSGTVIPCRRLEDKSSASADA